MLKLLKFPTHPTTTFYNSGQSTKNEFGPQNASALFKLTDNSKKMQFSTVCLPKL
jgi:hypothetical protein